MGAKDFIVPSVNDELASAPSTSSRVLINRLSPKRACVRMSNTFKCGESLHERSNPVIPNVLGKVDIVAHLRSNKSTLLMMLPLQFLYFDRASTMQLVRLVPTTLHLRRVS